MRQHAALTGLVVATTILFLTHADASELMSSADVMEAGAWQLDVYGRHAEYEPTVRVSGSGGITVPTSGGGTAIFSQTNADVEFDQHMDAAIAALTFRPRDGFHYRLKIGQVKEFDIEFDSAAHVNKLSAHDSGLVWGAGMRWNVVPGSIVSAAIAIDLSYANTTATLDRFQSNGVVAAASQRFTQDEYQGAVNVSRRWGQWEPYGGVKVMRLVTTLSDRNTKQRIRGHKDTVSPFLGLKWEVFPREAIVIEGSFLGEESVQAGFNFYF